MLGRLVWEIFIPGRWGREDLTDLGGMDHWARLLLQHYHHRESLVVLAGRKCTEKEGWRALDRGPHKSTMAHVPFLREEFVYMVGKGKGVVMPYLILKDLISLKLRPTGLKEEIN